MFFSLLYTLNFLLVYIYITYLDASVYLTPPSPGKNKPLQGIESKSLVNICRPKTITKASAATAAHLCFDATSVTLITYDVSRKEIARPSIEQRNSRQLKDFIEETPEVGLGSFRL